MSETSAFTLDTDHGATLHGVLHVANKPGPRPTIVVCHGFKGFMDWGFFPPLATLLASRGFTVVRFNYSGTGQLPGDDLCTDLDAFRRNTHSQEVAETLRVIVALGHDVGEGLVDREHIGLVGHSRGGGAAVLAAGHPDAVGTVKALVTWAAVATYDRYGGDDVKTKWRRDGELTIVNGRTNQELPLGLGLLDDLEHHRDRIDIEAAASRVTAPWLIVHGTGDQVVTMVDAHKLDRAATGTHELHTIDGSGHTFEAKHPFAGPTPALIEAMNATQTWLRRYLTP